MGKVNLPLIMKIVALIACAVAVGINVEVNTYTSAPRTDLVSNSFMYAVSSYIIILAFFLFWSILQSEVDKKFAAIVLICGFLWNVGGGIGVIIYHCDYGSYAVDTLQLIAAILAVAAGCVMAADGLHNLGVF